MGNPQSKNSEVIIAQSGANNARADVSLKEKVEIYSVLTILIISVITAILTWAGCKYCSRRAKKVLVKDIVSSLEMGRVNDMKPRPSNQQTTVQEVHSY